MDEDWVDDAVVTVWDDFLETLFCEGWGIDRGLDDSMSGCVICASSSCEA